MTEQQIRESERRRIIAVMEAMAIWAASRGDLYVAGGAMGMVDILSGEHNGKAITRLEDHRAYKDAMEAETKAAQIAKDLLR